MGQLGSSEYTEIKVQYKTMKSQKQCLKLLNDVSYNFEKGKCKKNHIHILKQSLTILILMLPKYLG